MNRISIDPTSTLNRFSIDLGSTLTRPWIDRGSIVDRPHIDSESTLKRPWIDRESTLTRPRIDPRSTLARPCVDDNCQRLHLGRNAALSDLRQQLEKDIPEFHEMARFQGERQLSDLDIVEVELQGLVRTSARKALAFLEEFVHQGECYGNVLHVILRLCHFAGMRRLPM